MVGMHPCELDINEMRSYPIPKSVLQYVATRCNMVLCGAAVWCCVVLCCALSYARGTTCEAVCMYYIYHLHIYACV